MNFLAHAYLSFNDPNILIGNLIADFIRGKQIDRFPTPIKSGIILHREIDAFTDNHPINKETKLIFNDLVGRYSSSFLDVSFDYFLALDSSREPSKGWQYFADSCYTTLERNATLLPPQFCSMFIYMKSENWLHNYRHKWMIERSFERLQRRAKFLADDLNVFSIFEENQVILQNCYDQFFPDLETFTKDLINNPINNV